MAHHSDILSKIATSIFHPDIFTEDLFWWTQYFREDVANAYAMAAVMYFSWWNFEGEAY